MTSAGRKPVCAVSKSRSVCESFTDASIVEKANRDLDDLTPLDARESLLIEHPPRKDFNEMSKFNFAGPYEPYRDHPSRPDSTGSNERLVYADYGVAHSRGSSQDSRHSGHRSPSLEGRHPTTAGYGMAY